ncbi:MAG TPA: CHASE2 domain-containing protein [Bryobacteraceae bacterium]|nr:CHASE2 domain-containing protein [Bryobacteraceae bacterium]
MKKPSPNKLRLGYAAILAGTLAVAIVSGWTPFAAEIDNYAYDWMFRLNPPAPAPAHSIILAIDDATFNSMGGVGGYRAMWTQAFELVKRANPKAVALDVVLTDPWKDPADDQRLDRAMEGVHNLVLAAHLENGRWEDPLPLFRKHAAAVGHDGADELSADGVTREIPLEERTATERHWSLALEAFRLDRGTPILESPGDLQVGSEVIPAARAGAVGRPVRVLYTRQPIPSVSLKDAIDHPELAKRFNGKVVFIGVTSISATYDRVATPYGQGRIPGVEVHAQLFETLERGRFLTDASDLAVLGFCLAAGILAGLIFAFLSGWMAYAAAGALVIAASAAPFLIFREGVVFPFFGPLASAWLTAIAAASYQHFVVRRALRDSETERQRYQQAIHFVTHEMRTPLTAIQGSSELMGRYNLSEEKRKQIAEMINMESKRLARMIQTFLDVERLSDGQMELKHEPFGVCALVEACLKRVRPIAERKNIRIETQQLEGSLEGDRELMEYAIYNLLTNAVKYSPPDTQITVACRTQGSQLRLSVQDQGIGMDAKELRQIFQKFYRTKRAEASGEAGTGIGLSIVEQIVHHHGGRMEVSSEPGRGSCFTVIFAAGARAAEPPAVSV